MAEHMVLELGPAGPTHAARTLARYLPGLSLGLVPLGPTRMLVPASTVRAIELEYGKANLAPVLARAGASGAVGVDDSGAIALLRARDTSLLPQRSPGPARIAGLDWHLAKTNAPAAWAMLGGPGSIAWGGIRVGQIDTGYTPHPALGFGGASASWVDTTLAETFFAPPPTGPFTDEGPGKGIDPLAGSMDGHGTRTAAALCGHAPGAAGGPFLGVAPKVPLVPVRIANHVWINHAQRKFAQAVDHLIDNAQVQVISLSMGIKFATIDRRLRAALNKAYDAGVIVVCAAGNLVQDVVAPARLNRTLAIAGAVYDERADVLRPWGGSSHGPEVEFSGPAEGIRRADWRNGTPIYHSGGDGTSYATAMTAGAAALWLAHHGSAIAARYPQPWQRVEAFKAAAIASVQVPHGWQPGSFGAGVIDLQALLSAPLPAPAVSPESPA